MALALVVPVGVALGEAARETLGVGVAVKEGPSAWLLLPQARVRSMLLPASATKNAPAPPPARALGADSRAEGYLSSPYPAAPMPPRVQVMPLG